MLLGVLHSADFIPSFLFLVPLARFSSYLCSMRISTFIPAAACIAGVSAQTGEFETPTFNITEALLANGINVSALPELAPLVERTLSSGCSIAVGPSMPRA